MSEVVVPVTQPIPRMLLLFAARGGCEGELTEALPGLAADVAGKCAHPLHALGLVRQRPDPIAAGIGENRGFEAGLDLRLEAGGSVEALSDAVGGIGEKVADWVHVDLSYAIAGPLHVIIENREGRVRYLYVMRRRADWTDAAYLAHYSQQHVKFGLRTQGIRGYSTHRVDREASRRAARATGLGVWAVSSVSELYIADVAEFFDKAMGSQVGDEAIADEERFVDRASSVACLMDVCFDELLPAPA